MQLVPLVFAAALVAAVVVGLWSATNAASGDAPRNLAALRLAETITGPEAVAQMSKLHGKGVGIVDGYIGHYDGPAGGAVLYVGEAASEKDAGLLLKRMEERIAAGNQYFTNLRPLTTEGVRVLSVRSGRENHYFWQAGSKVLWIGFDTDDQAGLAAAVRAFR